MKVVLHLFCLFVLSCGMVISKGRLSELDNVAAKVVGIHLNQLQDWEWGVYVLE